MMQTKTYDHAPAAPQPLDRALTAARTVLVVDAPSVLRLLHRQPGRQSVVVTQKRMLTAEMIATVRPDAVIAAFRGWLATTDRLGQDFGKYTLAGRPVADVHIRYGALDSDFAALCARLGLGEVALGRYKTGARGAERTDYRTYYDAEARARVASAFAPDIAAFGWRFDDEMPGSLPEQGKDG